MFGRVSLAAGILSAAAIFSVALASPLSPTATPSEDNVIQAQFRQQPMIYRPQPRIYVQPRMVQPRMVQPRMHVHRHRHVHRHTGHRHVHRHTGHRHVHRHAGHRHVHRHGGRVHAARDGRVRRFNRGGGGGGDTAERIAEGIAAGMSFLEAIQCLEEEC
jgi:hypothetical protein